MKCLIVFCFVLLSGTMFAQFGTSELVNHDNVLGQVGRMICFDFDYDGDNDLFAASLNGRLLVFFENIGGDSLASQIIVTRQSMPAMDTADIDGDGKIDLIAHSEEGVGWYKNNGDNTFNDFNLICDVFGCGYACDFDLDGDLDVVIAKSIENKITWFENDALGNFSNETQITSEGNEPFYLQFYDFNNDGSPDILASSLVGDIDVYMNNETEDFQRHEFSAFTYFEDMFRIPRAFYVDGDEYLDVVNPNTTLLYFENQEGLGFAAPQFIFQYNIEADFYIIDDISGDGNWDFFIGSDYTYSCASIRISGMSEQYFCLETEEAKSSSLLFADFDGDGAIDALEGLTSGGINWYKNDGSFAFANPISLKRDCYGPKQVQIVDYDNDNDDDVFILNGEYNGSKVSLYENNGFGEFGSEIIYCETLSDFDGSSIDWIEDLDNDGDFDIVYRTETGIKVMIKDGSEFQQTDIPYSSLVFIRLFDYDEDGFLDLFAATYTTLSYALNDGNGNFQEFNQLITYDNYINDFRFADMDNDDDNDIIVYASGVNMYCHINNGSGDYSEIYNIDNVNSNITSTAISIVDIDDDGLLDIVLAGGFYLKLFHNHGDNTFDNIVLIDYYSIEEVFLGCRVGDLDLDGDKDIVYKLVEEVYWLENFGYEFSHLPIQICNSYNDIIRDESYRELFLSDIDNDGYADIVTGEQLSNQLLWQKNYFNQLKISGDVFFDENQDGVRNEDEQGFLHSQISLSPSSLASYTNQMGNFWFAVDEGDYLVEYQDLEFWGLSTAYENYNVEIGGSQNNIPDTCDFGFYPEFIIDSLDVDIVEGASICGNYTAFWLNISNYGTTMPSGIIELNLDPAYTILYSEEICDSVVNNKYYWSYEDLDFFGNINFPVYLNSPPIELIGNTLTSVLSVYVLDDEENIVAFSDTLMNIFTCAYDPNDKIVRPSDETGHNFIEPGQELEYIIRFQNTGNDTALNIYIYDYIETDLNRVTFELMSSSHSVYILRDDNQLTFRFDSIMLPDSGANQLLSNGYVKYRISPIDELNPLTVINNTAYIYFDFNNPIQTNTTVSTISCWINPEVPIIEVMENLLFISGDSFYYIQWYLNGSPIIGANDMYYSATSSGDYSVEVFNEFGCANWSGIFPFVYNSIKEDSVQRYVYPNPFTDELYIDLPDYSGISVAVLTDIKGAVISKFIITENRKNLSDIAVDLDRGIYLLKLIGDSYLKVFKLVKK